MRCPSCGNENATGKFCAECGTPLALGCPGCGTPVQAGQKFCAECGAVLTAGAPERVAAAPVEPTAPRGVAQLRMVSVLFVDLVGFTSLSEKRDAEEVRELLSRYFDTARTIVGRYGGTVEKFIGDAVMAVWGSPVAREDDAERAVRAALDLIDAVRGFGEEVGAPALRARAGVATGQVASWENPGEGLVVGDRVNTAARVQSAADPDSVYVDTVTKSASIAAIAFTDAGEHEAKGKAKPLRLWRALRVVAGTAGSSRVDGLEASFLGRDFEMRQLKDLFHAAADRRAARLVAILGAAGVGKSRLRWEFFKYVDGLADTVFWHVGRCLSYGEGVAYWALAEMVRQRFGIAAEEPAETAERKLADGLARWVPDPVERDFLTPRLGALLGLVEPGLSRGELFAGWRLLFERLADQQPVLLVFDDMQWADPGLLDFVEHLLDWSAAHPITVLAFARPELVELRPGFAAGRRNATTVYLEPLPDAEMTKLLDELVPGLPDRVRRRIVARAEGVPLYAVETIRTLVDRDLVVARDGVYTLVGEVDHLDVPASLTSLIAARLDALDAAESRLVKDVSVMSGSFPRAAAAAVSGLPDDQLDRLLANLVRKEVLTVRADKLSPDRGQYAFTQTLLRTVAYDMLSRRERKTLHLAAARHLRAAFPNQGEDVAEVVAAHYADAFAAAGADPDAEDIQELACAAFIGAGRRATAVGAPETAEQAYRSAAQLATDEPGATALTEAAGRAAVVSGRYEAAVELLEAASAAHAAAGRRREAARVAAPLGLALSRLGRYETGIPRLQDALAELEAGPPDRALAEVGVTLARQLWLSGDLGGATAQVERALAVAEALDLPDLFSEALGVKGGVLVHHDRTREGALLLEAAVAIAEQNGVPEIAQRALSNLGDLRMTVDLPGAAEACEAAVAGSRSRGDRYQESVAVSNLMLAQLFTGRWAEAQRLAAGWLDTGDDQLPHGAFVHSRLLVLAALRGEPDQARVHHDGMVAWAGNEEHQIRLAYAAAAAEVALATGDTERALEVADPVVHETQASIGLRHEVMRQAWPDALEAALALGRLEKVQELLGLVGEQLPGLVPPYLRGQLARYRGLLAAAEGRSAEVESHLRAALETFARLEYPYWTAVAQVDLAGELSGQDRAGEALALLTEAAGTLERLGAAPQRDRARSALAVWSRNEDARPAALASG